MKKLITICLLIATAFIANAQDGKPTKEQTLAYLTKTFSLSDGEWFVDYMNEKVKVDYNIFTMDKITTKTSGVYNSERVETRYETSGIEWESLRQITISENKSIELQFNSSFKQIEYSSAWKEGFMERSENFLELYILETKIESFKKALGRLVEIAKEENKNPFED